MSGSILWYENMNSNDLRKSFFDFFKKKEHKIISSASLIPYDDPTLMFTNAGMNQFKNILAGNEKPKFKRAASSQKCIRVSGKHNDFEDVGHDGYHHTFFEMLGNWSFGDYYKEEAIVWAWELLTDIWGFDKNKLYVTVYHDDNEALELWKKATDIDNNKVLKFGEKDNFWEMGKTGPCGPCSEIHIDLGEGVCKKNHKCGVNNDCDRFIEIWNLVFIQFNRQVDTSLVPLEMKSIDTGMGLERLAAIYTKKDSNYMTDLFMPIFERIEKDSGVSFSEKLASFSIISDHIRALTCSLSDGAFPSNEGRGYILRKILRRAQRHCIEIGIKDPYLYKLMEVVVKNLGNVYPELKREQERVSKVIQSEEEKFLQTLETGLKHINGIINNTKDIIDGKEVFKLYDTYGFPVDLTKEIAEEHNLKVDIDGFNRLMNEQKEKGREARQDINVDDFNNDIIKNIAETSFIGYDHLKKENKLQLIIQNNEKRDIIKEGQEGFFISDETPFYAESGGQAGDKGWIYTNESCADVNDTFKFSNGIVMHKIKVNKGSFSIGDSIELEVNSDLRMDTARNHTATHLLQAGLRKFIGSHIKQAGSFVGSDYLRFDFNHFNALSDDEIWKIENFVNQKIIEHIPVDIKFMDKKEAVNEGAAAFFGDKYGDEVRVVTIGNVSKELCGGTHLDNVANIGYFHIISESSVASGVRRIEAITGRKAYETIEKGFLTLDSVSKQLKVPVNMLNDKIKNMEDRLKSLEKEVNKLKISGSAIDIDKILSDKVEINGIEILTARFSGMSSDNLRDISDRLCGRFKKGVVLVVNKGDDDVSIVIKATKNLVSDFNASDTIKEISKIVDGGGGGRPDMAQAGGKNPEKIGDMINKFKEILNQKFG